MLILSINETDPVYPAGLRSYLGENAPPSINALGNLAILNLKKLALFCSTECPEEQIKQAQDLIQTELGPNVAVISGFHSPGERGCLSAFLHGNHPIIICPARSLTKMRIRTEYKEPLNQGRLLFLSFFRSHRHRSDINMALNRNRFVAAMADTILVVHAARGGKTEGFCHEILGWKKPLFTFASDLNQDLMALGAKPLNVKELEH
jgi:predicted Rossmann fold nucleotide-binding protein DprA/Smf involved in DNA uptake